MTSRIRKGQAEEGFLGQVLLTAPEDVHGFGE